MIDVGCAELIGSGKVKVKQGVEIKGYTEKSVVFTDDSEIETDVVLFAYVIHRYIYISISDHSLVAPVTRTLANA